MNVNSGGPHILLFERDQQLAALLTSEFQLAGYECHPARTAVEVFDAIARYPIRLVLVNLAQAAAGRREFWVALDAQRRGRGVQVFTYRCMNIAGYGSDDSDEVSRTVLADIEVDGMLGVMNLVEAVRSRIPGSITGSFSRFSAIPPATSVQEAASPNKPVKKAELVEPPQVTVPLSMPSSGPALTAPAAPNPAQPVSAEPAGMSRPGNPPSGFTEKIRAVIYPGGRSFSPVQEPNWVPRSGEADDSSLNREAAPQRQQNSGAVQAARYQSSTDIASPAAPQREEESGLAQLSRMVRENHAASAAEIAVSDTRPQERPASPLVQQQGAQQTQMTHAFEEGVIAQKVILQRPRPVDATAISSLPLRASPIQDIPIQREQEYRRGQAGVQVPQPVDTPSMTVSAASQPPVTVLSSRTMSPPGKSVTSSPAETAADVEEEDEQQNITTGAENENIIARVLAEAPQQHIKQALNRASSAGVTTDDTLLDIVRSLPPMPTLPPQPQPPVLSGRATRSLGSVLLEGHLVPQNRLEVAQQIQRMLHGVDMNYPLGEILLMFKLLTPDQLLAASLVSYGLISTAQISALGRIRQELHSIGLEYDLESLLVLFRILSPEQLREVRASWSG